MAFTAYDSNPEPILDPRYVSIDFIEVRWNSTHYSESILPSHACSEEELGLKSSSGKYMKPHPYSEPFVE